MDDDFSEMADKIPRLLSHLVKQVLGFSVLKELGHSGVNYLQVMVGLRGFKVSGSAPYPARSLSGAGTCPCLSAREPRALRFHNSRDIRRPRSR